MMYNFTYMQCMRWHSISCNKLNHYIDCWSRLDLVDPHLVSGPMASFTVSVISPLTTSQRMTESKTHSDELPLQGLKIAVFIEEDFQVRSAVVSAGYNMTRSKT